jgi:hypothetical protein
MDCLNARTFGPEPRTARRLVTSLACALLSLAAVAAQAADLPVRYVVDAQALKAAVAGTPLSFTVYSDAACATTVSAQTINIEDLPIIEKLSTFTPMPAKGMKATRPAKAVELHATLTGVSPAASYFLAVTGTGVTPIGGTCQAQPGGVASGGARAYATVNAAAIGAPNLIAGRTHNFVSVTHPTLGSYCLTAAAGISPSSGTASVSVDWAESFGNVLFAYYVDSYFFHNCPPSTYEVITFDVTGTASDNVGFTIVVP